MAWKKFQTSRQRVRALVRRQHGVIARRQLLELGYSSRAIDLRIRSGWLHPIWPGVYAVGRPDVTRYGLFSAAVLTCGPGAVLSHESAASLWAIRAERGRIIHVTVPAARRPRAEGIVVHRRTSLAPGDVTERHGIPVTNPISTLVDLATRLCEDDLEQAVNDACLRDLTDPDSLRGVLSAMGKRPGAKSVRKVVDRLTFTFSRSSLERHFLPIARRAGLPPPLTCTYVNGYEVDFYWPDLGLVVEADGFQWHRTPDRLNKDRRRDQAHTAAGLTPLRFTHRQIRFEPSHVHAVLVQVVSRLRRRAVVS